MGADECEATWRISRSPGGRLRPRDVTIVRGTYGNCRLR